MLRDSALKIIRALKIEGGCNVQFALDPLSFKYFLIEVNPRVFAFVGPGLEGLGIPDRPRECEDRRGSDARRDPHCQYAGLVRADARLRGDEDRPLPVRQVLRRLEQARHADEGHGRGDVGRPARMEESLLKAVRSLETGVCHILPQEIRFVVERRPAGTISRSVRTTASMPSPS